MCGFSEKHRHYWSFRDEAMRALVFLRPIRKWCAGFQCTKRTHARYVVVLMNNLPGFVGWSRLLAIPPPRRACWKRCFGNRTQHRPAITWMSRAIRTGHTGEIESLHGELASANGWANRSWWWQ